MQVIVEKAALLPLILITFSATDNLQLTLM
jgi:hypothetical protein